MANNVRQLAQKIKYTYRMEEFTKNVPVKGKIAKEIKGDIHSPQCLTWFKNHNIIKPVGRKQDNSRNIYWCRGDNWQLVIEKLDTFERKP